MITEKDDNELIKMAQKGDTGAFEQLLVKYDAHVINIAKSFRNDEEDAKDIYQEVFMRVYKGLKNFQFKSEFSTWLYRITTNVCITYQQKKKKNDYQSIDKEYSGSDDDDSTTMADYISGEGSTDELAVSSDMSKHINRALDTLPPQQKMAFTLKYFQEYKIREIAEIMQCNEGTVKRYLFTAANKMRNQLKGILEN